MVDGKRNWKINSNTTIRGCYIKTLYSVRSVDVYGRKNYERNCNETARNVTGSLVVSYTIIVLSMEGNITHQYYTTIILGWCILLRLCNTKLFKRIPMTPMHLFGGIPGTVQSFRGRSSVKKSYIPRPTRNRTRSAPPSKDAVRLVSPAASLRRSRSITNLQRIPMTPISWNRSVL
jgi:hypothetical protein